MADLQHTITVERPAHDVYASILDVEAWWGRIDGTADQLGGTWTYEVPDVHRTVQRVTELTPGSRIEWTVVDSFLSFVEHTDEWTGTALVFDIDETVDGTRVVFTHRGLDASHECFDVCDNAWGEYIAGSLRQLLEGGAGRPNSLEGQEAIDAGA